MNLIDKSMHSLRPWIKGVLSKGKIVSTNAEQFVKSGYAVRRGATSHFFREKLCQK